MHAKRAGAGRFPQHIILNHARAAPVRQPRNRLADARGKHNPRHRTVGFPRVANLPRQRRIALAFAPVDFVRGHAGFKLTAKQRLKSRAQPGNQRIIQHPTGNQKPVARKHIEVVRGEYKTGIKHVFVRSG